VQGFPAASPDKKDAAKVALLDAFANDFTTWVAQKNQPPH